MAESYLAPHFCESFINVFLSWPKLPLSYTADGSVLCAKCGAETQVLCPEPSARHSLFISKFANLSLSTVQIFLGSQCRPAVIITSP